MKLQLTKWMRPFLLVILAMTFQGLMAQNITVNGVVTSHNDESALPGVSVLIKGTTTGTVTDLDGKYSIAVNQGDILIFSYVSYLHEEITIDGATTTLDVSLIPDMVGIDQIVVIGYGTQKKSDLTGAVTTVTNEEVNRKTVATIEQALQGVAAGVSVTSNSGSPGDGAKIRIRGYGSINGSDPLYVIDGVPSGGPGSVNPSDIESISILKDAAASAIYGSRGANGVVMITTKKGKKGFHVDFDAQYGSQNAWKTIDMLGSEAYSLYLNELNYNRGRRTPLAARDPYNQEFDTDWHEAVFQSAPIQRYNLSVSGATERISYNVSGGYFDQEGIITETGYKKYFGRVNTEFNWKRLKVGQTFSINSSHQERETIYGGRTTLERVLTMPPTVAIYDTAAVGGFAGTTGDHGNDAVNPLAILKLMDTHTHTTGVLGSVYADVEIVEGLRYNITAGIDNFDQQNTYYDPVYEIGDYYSSTSLGYDTTYNEARNFLIQNTLTYSVTLGLHNIEALAGYSQERGSWRTYNRSKTIYSADSIVYGSTDPRLYEQGLASYFGRVNYSYADKYLLQFNIRRDGSSKFGPENKWGLFPSISGGWVASKEDFLESMNAISFLKIRGSYGQIGNQKIDDYKYSASLNPYQTYHLAGVDVAGTGPSGFPNPLIQWETQIQSNAAVELSMFKNKVNLTAEYYYNTTEDMLINITMPVSNGTSNFPPQNAGSVRDKGFELSLNYRDYDRTFKYSITGNFTTINNEVIDLGPTDAPITGGGSELGNTTLTAVGHSIGEFYGFITDGIYTSEDQIDPVFAPDASVGDIRFVDLSGPAGVPDGILTDDDRTFIGSSIPNFVYGLNLQAEYKGFDLSMTFQGISGNKLMRETKLWTEGMYSNFNASTDVNNRFIPEDVTITSTDAITGEDIFLDYTANTNTNLPWAIKNDPNKNAGYFSDRFIEDGSYMRLKDLTIGYNLPESFIDKIKVSKARVYVTGMNLITVTDYTGYDPEIGGNNLSRGIDNGYYPQAKTFLGGIQLSF